MNELLKATQSFQKTVVRKWNKDIDEVTLSLFMGMIGIDESESKNCGAISLDFLLKTGLIILKDDWSWELAPDWKDFRPMIFGDAKTTENMSKFIRDMQGRNLSLSDSGMQADVFVTVMKQVMTAPGDWHAGMNMLQSIYKLWYKCLLCKFQEMLGWKRIQHDVRSCYYQASRLVKFVHDELVCYLMHMFVSDKDRSEECLSDKDAVCKLADEFVVYLHELKSSPDEWTRVCALFVIMSSHFLTFVASYRTGDSIGIENGYLVL